MWTCCYSGSKMVDFKVSGKVSGLMLVDFWGYSLLFYASFTGFVRCFPLYYTLYYANLCYFPAILHNITLFYVVVP